MGTDNAQAEYLGLNKSMSRIAYGDVLALDALYKDLKKPVFMLALSILRDYPSAEDIMQETFLKVNEKADTYTAGTNPKAWVLTIARNLALNTIKKRSRETLTLEELGETAADENGLLDGNDFTHTMRQLDEPERSIVTLRIVCGLRHAEIAKIVGLTANDTRVRYSRALKKLKKYYLSI
jgi:RNA polymerase sigma-70 factor (ECF subfamily)